jgi:alkanesulfonate monooxygenase SsuD/methylene tetrahydromethanopterin reductase-like flavin-dependent oxidoreductase (luciferase family)
MKFGVIVLQDMPYQELVRLWQQFETLGFDSTWVADHFINYANPEGLWYDGWTVLTALASVTSKIRIGTLVTSIALRNPAVLARQAMTVDHISNGRLDIGIGAGAPGSIDPSYQMIGIGDWTFNERTARFREQVEILDRLLSNTKSNYEGKYYQIDGAIMSPRPIQKPRPPITIAAHTSHSLRIAAEYADVWVSFGDDFGAPVDNVVKKTEKRIKKLERYCDEIGRDTGTLGRSLLIFGEEANTAFTSENNFTDIVERYASLGLTELVLFYPFFAPDQIPTFEKIAKDVIPALRDAY